MKQLFKPLALISTGIIIAVFLLSSDKITFSPSPPDTPKAHTVIRFSPHPILTSSDSGKASITIDTGGNSVYLMQVKFAYNPNIIYDLKIKKSQSMSHAQELNNFVDTKKGTATFIINIPKEEQGFKGKETIADISFKTRLRDGDRTNISFTQETMITDTTSPYTLLKKAENTQIIRKD